ncbi:MAG TPA: c-type cytochrome biogenesis protein CcmI [Candidatus Competibacteraceae bacterium]|nr:c-type cytochrome biogenesis protein CcmI [Candidatus Competibacteraceae bacterium]
MTPFWLIAGLLTLLACALVLVPLWHARPRPAPDRDAINAQLFRERLAELEAERRAGRLSEADYQGLREDLERTLLADIPEAASTAVRTDHPALMLGIVAGVALPLAALAWFYLHGYRGEVADWLAARARLGPLVEMLLGDPEAQLPEQLQAELPNFIRVLQARLAADGLRDAEGLYLLGLAYLQVDASAEAQAVLERAHRLAPERADITVSYAQSQIMANAGRLDPASAKLLEEVLRTHPEHQGARMLLGFAAFNAGDYAMAITAWQSLLSAQPLQSEVARLLGEAIERARQRQSEAANAPAAPLAQGADANAQARITVTVELSPELQSRLSTDDSLFVFAKASAGPPMPLAVVRQPATGFPVQLVLDDSRAMMPEHTLSRFPQVVVQARVSKGSGATAASGDLESTPQPVDLSAGPQTVRLAIDRVVP